MTNDMSSNHRVNAIVNIERLLPDCSGVTCLTTHKSALVLYLVSLPFSLNINEPRPSQHNRVPSPSTPPLPTYHNVSPTLCPRSLPTSDLQLGICLFTSLLRARSPEMRVRSKEEKVESIIVQQLL